MAKGMKTASDRWVVVESEGEWWTFPVCYVEDGYAISSYGYKSHSTFADAIEYADNRATLERLRGLVESRSEVQGGQLCIVGSRIPIREILVLFQGGLSTTDVVELHPSLNHAVLCAIQAIALINRAKRLMVTNNPR